MENKSWEIVLFISSVLLSSLVEMLSGSRSAGAGKRVRHQTGSRRQQLGLAGPQGADSQTLTEEKWEVNYARAQVMVKAAGAIFHLSVCLAHLVSTGAQRVCDRSDEILVKCIQMSWVAAARSLSSASTQTASFWRARSHFSQGFSSPWLAQLAC